MQNLSITIESQRRAHNDYLDSTITTTASTNTSILAIDLGKYKSVACGHDQATGEYRFTDISPRRWPSAACAAREARTGEVASAVRHRVVLQKGIFNLQFDR